MRGREDEENTRGGSHAPTTLRNQAFEPDAQYAGRSGGGPKSSLVTADDELRRL